MKNKRYNLVAWSAILLGLVTVALLAVLTLMVIESQATDQQPPLTAAYIQLNPVLGEPGAVVVVSGEGWAAGETVLVYLVKVESGATDGVVYASAVASANGRILTQTRFPQDGLWAKKQSAIFEARGNTSGRIARATLQVVQPTVQPETPTLQPPTDTPVPTLPPTLTPTPEPPTATPTPLPPTATLTPTPQPPKPTPIQITDWRGEYFNNVNLTGSPRVRNDKQVDFDWGTGSPMTGIPADGFSARWTRRLPFEAKTYRFHVRVDDGARLWVDGQLVIDQWHDGSSQDLTADCWLAAGKHDIRLEMYEHTGQAVAVLWWEEVKSYPDWKGEYFANTTLSGTPAVVRNDLGIGFDWGTGAPTAGLPADNFSVRWTRQIQFPAGQYRFTVEVDDGVRLWIDDVLVIDQWHDGISSYTGNVYLNEGVHTVRMEMYEHTGSAMARMWWALQTGYPDWKGHYYANPDLNGTPEIMRNDATINFNWGTGAANPGLPADNFSVRWTRNMDFTTGTYRFCATADDGVSVVMDDTLPYIIRQWQDGSGTYCNDIQVAAGRHKLTVEYFEHLGGSMIKFWIQQVGTNEIPSQFNR